MSHPEISSPIYEQNNFNCYKTELSFLVSLVHIESSVHKIYGYRYIKIKNDRYITVIVTYIGYTY